MRHLIPSLLLLVGLAAPAVAQTSIEGAPASPAQLVQQWTSADANCVNAATPAIEAIGACEQRDTVSKLLALSAYCHEPPASGGPARWEPCGKTRAAHTAVATFQRMGGVFVLSALLNGPTLLYFIVDSGAATVQIPEETAEVLRRAGTLTDADFVGQNRFVLADGRGMQQRLFRLRSLQIGGRTMENLLATIGPPKSRALLGQSFLRRLSWWKVDNVNNRLEFEFTGSF